MSGAEIAEWYRKAATIERVELLLVCRKLLEAGGAGYTPDEDVHVLHLANVLHRYTAFRALMNEGGLNTLEPAAPPVAARKAVK